MKSHKIYALGLLTAFLFFTCALSVLAEDEVPQQSATAPPEANQPAQEDTAADRAVEEADISRELSEEEKLEKNFKNEEAYLDHYEAVRSKQYVRRAILSSVITATNKVAFDRFYVNHLLGFHAVYQKSNFAKYVSGVQGLSFGYVFNQGHAFEAGMDFSAINNVFAGYRYFYRPNNFLVWPFAGLGFGYDVGLLKFAEGPPEAQAYTGAKEMGFITLGILVPLVDVAIKAEIRGCAYKGDRFLLTQGIGAILFF